MINTKYGEYPEWLKRGDWRKVSADWEHYTAMLNDIDIIGPSPNAHTRNVIIMWSLSIDIDD